MAFSRLMLTTSGKILFAKAQQGKLLKLTRVAVGDGVLGSGSIVNRTTLISEKLSMLIDAVQLTDDGATATVVAQMSNAALKTGFHFRELGIYAEDPDTHTETLYVYDNAGSDGEYIPDAAAGVSVNEYLKLLLQVSDAPNITFNASGNPLYILRDELGVPNGVATLDKDGKVISTQWPEMNYDPKGAAETAIDVHNRASDAHPAIDARIYKTLGKAVVNLTAIRADGAAYDNLLIGGISVDPSLRTTDAAGKLTLLLDAGSYTLTSSANGQYVDTIMPPVNIAIKAGDVKNITMTESYVNSDTHIFTITSSISKKFSRKVQSVDMCLVAGGGDGGDGGAPADGNGGEGGYGGLHGEVAYYERLPITPESQQSFIVGAPGGDTQGLGKTARGGTKGSNGNSGSSLGVRGGSGGRFRSSWDEAEKRVYAEESGHTTYTIIEFNDGYEGGIGNTKTVQTQSIMDGAIIVSVEDGNGGCGGGAAGSFPVRDYNSMRKQGTRGTDGMSGGGGYGGNRCEALKLPQQYFGGAGGRGGYDINKASGGGGNGSSCNEAASNGFNCTIDALKPQSYGSGGYGGGGAGGGFSKGVGGSGSKGKQGVIYLRVHYAA